VLVKINNEASKEKRSRSEYIEPHFEALFIDDVHYVIPKS
jgi:hypothetical protein